MQLSIIIVNYNVCYFLEQCLYALQRAVAGMDAEVIVVDNASSDGSMSYLKPLFPSTHFIESGENFGFARANNLALSKCSGEFVLFLNPDTLVAEDTLQKSVLYLTKNPAAGALGVRMVDGKGRFLPESKRSFPSPWVSFAKLGGLSALFPRSKTFNRYALGHLDEHSDHAVEVLAGACMFVRRNLLQQLNGFDESYFLYGEDIDLSYRIKQAGYNNIYFAQTSIIHFKGESSRNLSLTRVKYFYQAMLVFVQKHYNAGAAGLFSTALSTAIALRGALAALKRIIKPFFLQLADACIVFAALQSMRFLWIDKIRNGEDFNVPFVAWAMPLFSLVFVLAAAVSGLYERKFKTSRAFVSMTFAMICMLAVYSLLPENIRFSRGVVLFGGVTGALLAMAFRQLLIASNASFITTEKAVNGQTVVVSSEEEYERITLLLASTLNAEPLGRIAINENNAGALCNITGLPSLEKKFGIARIIFCVGENSVKNIIAQSEKLSKGNKRFLFHAAGSNSMIGSQTLAPGSEVVVPGIDYKIAHPYQKRMKRLLDIKLALLFILLFPVHFVFHPRPARLIKNLFSILAGSKTWVGYAGPAADLPALKPGLVPQTGKATELSQKADRLYAKNYDWWQDFLEVFRQYKNL